MSLLQPCFASLASAKRQALIPFVVAGDPSSDYTLDLMHSLVAAGADIIELGVPFSDPMADGKIIQKASERALLGHGSLAATLAIVAKFRQSNQRTPIVLMGYLNPILSMGYTDFASQASTAQVDAVLTVDLPPEEATDYISELGKNIIDPIFLIAPNSPTARIEKITAVCRGYIYFVALKGVTGADNLDAIKVAEKVADIRQHTDLPIAVGFGVKDSASAKNIAQIADGVVVGSAFIRLIENNLDNLPKAQKQIVDLAQSMRQAMDS